MKYQQASIINRWNAVITARKRGTLVISHGCHIAAVTYWLITLIDWKDGPNMSFLHDTALRVTNVEEIEPGGECLLDNHANFRNKASYLREKSCANIPISKTRAINLRNIYAQYFCFKDGRNCSLDISWRGFLNVLLIVTHEKKLSVCDRFISEKTFKLQKILQ